MDDMQGISSAAMLVYGFTASFMSGTIVFQVLTDLTFGSSQKRCNTLVIWVLDIIHSAFILFSLCDYFITFSGAEGMDDHIPWSIALTVAITMIQALFIQYLFTRELHRCSDRNWTITAPILVLSFIQLVTSSVSTFEMMRLQKFSTFHQLYPGLVFATSLSLSVVVNLLITGWLCYFLRSLQREFGLPSEIIGRVKYYTLSCGWFISITTIGALLFWVALPTDPACFLALYLVIGKLYVISFLAVRASRTQILGFRGEREGWGELFILRSKKSGTEIPNEPLDGMFVYYPKENVQQVEVIVKETFDYGKRFHGASKEYHSQYLSAPRKPTLAV
ncbi:uncharacterized protein EV420DRAFT_1548738 [Desarmillaria tabescens]|uniref:DUF6534 domain-containing protein n=1 Tax=Armillaria tabescens TaxID=1929756 RepID=A0AA39KCM8_ARMTA|nr:uncharacterized protein EV420DRAFT_1548738 [Desarmillaria tabescens]KAK0457515.1 hypothetical protein EV420DRAFT_1548738 [Desarmillaria tabescens]